MMNSMRKMAGGFVAKLLMLFLIITFGVWGVGDILRSSSSNYAAQVGSEVVTIPEFQRNKASFERRAEAMGMKNFVPGMMDLPILRQLVQQKLINMALKDLGLYASNELLAKELRAQPIFQNKDGSFNKGAFQQVLQAERITEATLLNQVKDETNGKFLIASLDMSDVAPPTTLRELMATTSLETRDAWIVTIPPVEAPSDIKEEDLQVFYNRNKSVLYLKPESRTLEYVALKPAQIDAAIDRSITSEMVAAASKTQPGLSQQELRESLRRDQRDNVMHKIEGDLDDALAGGATLADALSKAGISAPIRTLNDVKSQSPASEDDVVKAVTQQGFQMGDGETSGLIISEGGTPLIVHVKSLHVAGAQPYEDVVNDVRAHVSEEMRREAARTRVSEVRSALSKITGDDKKVDDAELQAVLKAFELSPRRVTGLSRPQGNATVNGVPAPLQQAIFERSLNTVAGPLTLPNGGQMLAIVNKISYPSAETVKARTKLQTGKEKELSDALNQTVQARSFTSFAEKHRVKINEALFVKSQAPDQP